MTTSSESKSGTMTYNGITKEIVLKPRIRFCLFLIGVLFVSVLASSGIGTLTDSTILIFTGVTTENSQRKIYAYQLENSMLTPLKSWFVYRGVVVYPVCSRPFAQLIHVDDNVQEGETTIYLSSYTNERQTSPIVIDSLPHGEMVSPDGHYLFFQNNTGSWILDVYTGFQTKLTDYTLFVTSEWSSDSKHLVVTSIDTTNVSNSLTSVYQLDDLTRVRTVSGYKRYSWSFDNSYVIETDVESNRIYQVNPATYSRVQLLATNAAYAVWSANSYVFAYFKTSGGKNFVEVTNIATSASHAVVLPYADIYLSPETVKLLYASDQLVLVQRDYGVDVVDMKKETVVSRLETVSIYSTVCVFTGPYH